MGRSGVPLTGMDPNVGVLCIFVFHVALVPPAAEAADLSHWGRQCAVEGYVMEVGRTPIVLRLGRCLCKAEAEQAFHHAPAAFGVFFISAQYMAEQPVQYVTAGGQPVCLAVPAAVYTHGAPAVHYVQQQLILYVTANGQPMQCVLEQPQYLEYVQLPLR